jgi:hypothetical protein
VKAKAVGRRREQETNGDQSGEDVIYNQTSDCLCITRRSLHVQRLPTAHHAAGPRQQVPRPVSQPRSLSSPQHPNTGGAPEVQSIGSSAGDPTMILDVSPILRARAAPYRYIQNRALAGQGHSAPPRGLRAEICFALLSGEEREMQPPVQHETKRNEKEAGPQCRPYRVILQAFSRRVSAMATCIGATLPHPA